MRARITLEDLCPQLKQILLDNYRTKDLMD